MIPRPTLLVLILVIILIGSIVVLSAGPQTIREGAKPMSPAVTARHATNKYIAFRDDDIGFGQPSTLAALDQVHIDENVPVTLAVIPQPNRSVTGNELLGSGPLHDHLLAIANNQLFEFAQHGYHHTNYAGSATAAAPTAGTGVRKVSGTTAPLHAAGESPNFEQRVNIGTNTATKGIYSEFYGRPYADQYNAIKQGRDDIKAAFGVTPTTFIPPWNKGDVNTLKATAALGFTLYHTSYYDFHVHEASLQGIMVQDGIGGFPYSGSSNWPASVSDLTRRTDAVLNAASGGQHYVIEYHFWAFENPDGSANATRVGLFKQYIEHLKSRGDVTFVTLAGQNLRQPTQLSLSASTTNPSASQTIALSGTLQTKSTMPVPVTNAPVYLHASPDNLNWIPIPNMTVMTDGRGAYSFTRSFDQGTYYMRTYYPGNSTFLEGFSPAVKVT